ncbi:MAG: hypothetical protein JW717_09780 [Marinilabiliaceae bacterium]|nr:hypothetical protein [Marinilabiliaceae bacterium]
MMNDILFLMYSNDSSKSIKAKQIIKLGEKEYYMSFELSWVKIPQSLAIKDDFHLSKIDGTSTVDDLLLITDSQLN